MKCQEKEDQNLRYGDWYKVAREKQEVDSRDKVKQTIKGKKLKNKNRICSEKNGKWTESVMSVM